MAAESGRTARSVAEGLFDEPTGFEFYQAVRLMGLLWPDRVPVGRDSDPREEVVEFVSDVSFVFPLGDIAGLETPTETGGRARMNVSFLGVATPNAFGSLPYTYAEQILDLGRDKEYALRAFVDIFNHRITSLFYRAWEKYRPALAYERGEHDAFERALFALIGLATPGLRERLPVSDHALLFRAGLLARRPASVCAIERLVMSYFRVPAAVEQFQAHWYPIDGGDLNRLGQANSSLGSDLFTGEEVLLDQFAFRLRLGPMGWRDYAELLPSGEGFPALRELVRLMTGEEFDFEIQLVLKREDTPELTLGGEGRARLGWTTWLSNETMDRDPDDVVLSSDTRPVVTPLQTGAAASMEATP
jgi:type VI secretion system protein ImpH